MLDFLACGMHPQHTGESWSSKAPEVEAPRRRLCFVAVSQDDEFSFFAVTDASVSLADAPEHPPAIDEHFWEAVDARIAGARIKASEQV